MARLQSDQEGRANGHAEARDLPQHGRIIKHDAEALALSVQDAIGSVEQSVGGHLRERPYTTLALAAGAGFVLGGGLATRLTRVMFGVGGRLALAMAARELGVRLGLTPSNQSQASTRTKQ